MKQWRELEAQVQPPLIDKELVNMFMDTLQSSYSKIMVGIVSSSFVDPLKDGERIESGLKNGRIQDASNIQTTENESFSSSQEEEEDETNAVMEDVKYSHGAPAKPYGLPSSQWSSFPAPRYPYGQPKMPIVPYQHPWIGPHSNQ